MLEVKDRTGKSDQHTKWLNTQEVDEQAQKQLTLDLNKSVGKSKSNMI